MTYNAANRAQIRQAEKAAKIAEANRRAVLATITGTTEGRQYLWDSLSEAHIFSNVYDDNPSRMAFLVGERNAGLRLLAELVKYCPEEFIQMMREANERSTVAEQPGSQDGNRGDQGPDDSADRADEGGGD